MTTTAARRNMKPPPAVLTNAFYAFYDLHRPAYYAFAQARLSTEEARVAVAHLFSLVADNWTSVVNERCPSAWAWERHTQVIARRSGRTTTPVQDISLLHDQLLFSIGEIAALTGTDAATVAALLAAAYREASDRTGRASLWTSMIKQVPSNEARWRHTFRLRTAIA
ncbi:hypothetical protein ACFYX5_32690 [Streptomyces rubiginosohelvolus]|uniref:hypothetical protein n=1 Tax=Streptomyces rubiginosohelvolus TaxID=67362 RepID=UPI0036938585